MQTKKRHPFIFLLNILIFLLAIILHPAESFISIKTATPLLILPILTAFSIFRSVYACIAVGLITGICFDALTSGAYCFNTAIFMCIAVAVNLLANNLFNKNIRSAVLLSLLAATAYFLLKWIIFFAIGADIENSLLYLLKYAFPSAAYSAVFVFPFYYIYKRFNNLS